MSDDKKLYNYIQNLRVQTCHSRFFSGAMAKEKTSEIHYYNQYYPFTVRLLFLKKYSGIIGLR